MSAPQSEKKEKNWIRLTHICEAVQQHKKNSLLPLPMENDLQQYVWFQLVSLSQSISIIITSVKEMEDHPFYTLLRQNETIYKVAVQCCASWIRSTSHPEETDWVARVLHIVLLHPQPATPVFMEAVIPSGRLKLFDLIFKLHTQWSPHCEVLFTDSFWNLVIQYDQVALFAQAIQHMSYRLFLPWPQPVSNQISSWIQRTTRPRHRSSGMSYAVLIAFYEHSSLEHDNVMYFLNYLQQHPDKHCDVFLAINGVCTATLPTIPRMKIIRRPNEGYDFGAFACLTTHLQSQYRTVYFMNSSVRGPFIPADVHWTQPFETLLQKPDTHLVGASINVLTNVHSNEFKVFQKTTSFAPPFTHVQTPMFAMSWTCFLFLQRIGFWTPFLSPILSPILSPLLLPTFTKLDAIIRGEIMMSQLVLHNGWNISCTLEKYASFDYRTLKTDPNPNSVCGDPLFVNAYFGKTVTPEEAVFFKTNRSMINITTLPK